MSDWDEVEEPELVAPAEPLSPARALRTLTVGFLGLAPLLFAYELVLRTDPQGARNTSELLVGLAFTPFGEASADVRTAVLAVATLAAIVVALRRKVPLGAAMARTVLEGVGGALALGPLLFGLSLALAAVFPTFEATWDSSVVESPSLTRAGRLIGSAAWEELAFRVGVYSAVFLIVRGLVSLMRSSPSACTWAGEIAGLLGSSTLFAAVHLDSAVGWLGVGGEPFDAAVFLWRALAGLLLGLLFRWRGAGVAAWSHALFNLGIEVGIGQWGAG